jgi:hypothetical protein
MVRVAGEAMVRFRTNVEVVRLQWTPHVTGGVVAPPARVNVRVNVPATPGVPLKTPVPGLIDKPDGWPETDHVYGAVPPNPVMVWL